MRIAFFEKGTDAFLEVGVGAGIDAGTDGGLDVVGQMAVGEFDEKALGGFHGGGAVANEAMGEGVSFAHEVGFVDDAVDEAEGLGFSSRDETAGEQEVAAGFFAELGAEEGGDDGRHEADADFCESKLGLGDSEREIAKGGDAHAAGDGSTVDGSDAGFGQGIQSVEESGNALGVGVVVVGGGEMAGGNGHGMEVFDVETGAERGTGAGDDDDTAGLTGGERFEGLGEFFDELVIEGVPLLGAVKEDGVNAGVGVGMECGVVRHACSPEGTQNLRAFSHQRSKEIVEGGKVSESGEKRLAESD
jgi:hypothetical protein